MERKQAFKLSWPGTKRGSGVYRYDSMLNDGSAVYALEQSKKCVFWYHTEERIWIYSKRSELQKAEPSLFAHCEGSREDHPAELEEGWHVLDKTCNDPEDEDEDPWRVDPTFQITPIEELRVPGGGTAEKPRRRKKRRREQSRESSPTAPPAPTKRRKGSAPPADSSISVSKEDAAEAKELLDNINELVRENTEKLKKYDEDELSEGPWTEGELEPIEDRIKKLEEYKEEELKEYIGMAKSVRDLKAMSRELFKEDDPKYLRRQGIDVLGKLDMLGEATVTKLRVFLKEYRKKNLWITGYGYISLKGKKSQLVKQAKRVLRQLDRGKKKR